MKTPQDILFEKVRPRLVGVTADKCGRCHYSYDDMCFLFFEASHKHDEKYTVYRCRSCMSIFKIKEDDHAVGKCE